MNLGQACSSFWNGIECKHLLFPHRADPVERLKYCFEENDWIRSEIITTFVNDSWVGWAACIKKGLNVR